MFSIPYTFSNEDESYITIPVLKRFAKESIISLTNAGGKGQCIKFGIIISKEKGPSTFKELAVKSYLADGVVIISICGEELKELFDNRGNLLDLIERKTTEIMLDSTTDLVKAGLYKS